jgi:hypothetical protein
MKQTIAYLKQANNNNLQSNKKFKTMKQTHTHLNQTNNNHKQQIQYENLNQWNKHTCKCTCPTSRPFPVLHQYTYRGTWKNNGI